MCLTAAELADAAAQLNRARPTCAPSLSPPVQVMLFDCRGFEVEKERESAVGSLGVVDTPIDDPRFNAITK